MEFLSTPWGFGSIVVSAITLLTVVWRVGYLSLSKAGILIGKNGTMKKASPHTTCPHARDIMELIHRTMEHVETRQELRMQLLESQMRFYEETEEEVLGLLKASYLSLMSDKNDAGISYVQHPEYTAYVMTLKAIASDVKVYIRGCFKTNHYAELDSEGQRLYIEKKEAVIFQKVTEALNLYWKGEVVTRGELYKANRLKLEEYSEYVYDIFNKAFSLARETSERLDKMEFEYSTFIEGTLGCSG